MRKARKRRPIDLSWGDGGNNGLEHLIWDMGMDGLAEKHFSRLCHQDSNIYCIVDEIRDSSTFMNDLRISMNGRASVSPTPF